MAESIGGQAVIEGVMMRNKNILAVAVRNEKGKIIVKKEKIKLFTGILTWPFIRGIVAFFQMLVIGIKTLTYSSNIALNEDEKLDSWGIAGIISLSFVIGIGMFVLVPYIVTYFMGFNETTEPVLFNLIDSIIKMILFVAYVAIIGQVKDVRRVFQYHGAEHKTVNCYEAGKKITIQNVKKFSTIHPRCGTSFILLVMIVGIFVLSLISPLAMLFSSFSLLPFFVQKIILFFTRILFLLPIAAISYEILKLAGKYKDNVVLNAVNYPGMLIQKLTTQEPDNKQIEVAIKAIEKVI
ncbi:MAG: DUF1385 domain-containing protein [Candidatus Woesearchaeota archaeon]|jgi:uncharacterized protein YqhQ